MSKKTIYSFIGLPASGKGTQAKIFAEENNLELVGMGDLIRCVIEENRDLKDPFVNDIKKRYDAGVPQPDDVACDLFQNKINSINKSVIFDNFPFNTNQAVCLENFIKSAKLDGPKIFYIKINPETSIRRISSRLICPNCGRTYFKEEATKCEECKIDLVTRADDNEETVRKRITFYSQSIAEILNFYADRNCVIEVNGELSIPEVAFEVKKKYEQHFK